MSLMFIPKLAGSPTKFRYTYMYIYIYPSYKWGKAYTPYSSLYLDYLELLNQNNGTTALDDLTKPPRHRRKVVLRLHVEIHHMPGGRQGIR